MTRQYGFTTRQLHAGQVSDPTTGARAVPIYQTTSDQFRSSGHAAQAQAIFTLAGVSPDFIRLSVGIEDIDDILRDFDQAFDLA